MYFAQNIHYSPSKSNLQVEKFLLNLIFLSTQLEQLWKSWSATIRCEDERETSWQGVRTSLSVTRLAIHYKEYWWRSPSGTLSSRLNNAGGVEVEWHDGGVAPGQSRLQLGRDSFADLPDFDFPVSSCRGEESSCARERNKGDIGSIFEITVILPLSAHYFSLVGLKFDLWYNLFSPL